MFDRSMWAKLPRNMLQGHDILNDLLAVVDGLYLSGDPLLVTNLSPDHIVDDRVRDWLNDVMSTSLDRANFEPVERVVDVAREADAGYFIVPGGGRPIDMVKVASDRLDCGSISVPTAVSHDGIVSGWSSIPEDDTHHSIAADPPLTVVADTRLLTKVPWELATAGCAGIVLSYTVVKDWKLAHRLKNVEYSECASALSQATAEMPVDNADSIELGLEEPAWVVTKVFASSGAAMSIAGSSRPASGAEHLFSHQLDRIAPGSALHDHQVGVGSIATEYFHSGTCSERTDIRNALLTMGASATADELGIGDKTIIEALATVHKVHDRCMIPGNGVNEEAAIEAATITGVI